MDLEESIGIAFLLNIEDETGRHMPDIDTLKKMAKELNVPVNYFFANQKKVLLWHA